MGEFDQLVNLMTERRRIHRIGRLFIEPFGSPPTVLDPATALVVHTEMTQTIATVTLVVAEYDAAINFYRDQLGFALLADIEMGGGKRWVVVGPRTAAAPDCCWPGPIAPDSTTPSAIRPVAASWDFWRPMTLPATMQACWHAG